MPSHRKQSPKPWHFWRTAFWKRPALILLAGVLLGLTAVSFLAAVPGDVATAGAIARAGHCGAGEHTDCLLRRRAEVAGPHGRGRRWSFYAPGSERTEELDEVAFPGWRDRRLRSGDVVEVLLWNGEVVVVRTPDGDRIETTGYGAPRWTGSLALALLSLGVAVLAVQGARGRRSTLGGWWVVSAAPSEFAGPGWVNTATAPVILGGVVLAALSAPAPPWWMLTVIGGVLLIGLISLLPGSRWRRRRQVTRSPADR